MARGIEGKLGKKREIDRKGRENGKKREKSEIERKGGEKGFLSFPHSPSLFPPFLGFTYNMYSIKSEKKAMELDQFFFY